MQTFDQPKKDSMTNAQALATLGASLVVGASLIAVVYLAGAKVDDVLALQKTQLQATAVDGCLKSAQIETTQLAEDKKSEVRTVQIVKDIYVYCLRDKGFDHQP